MKKFLNNIKAEASQLRMSTAEKAAMKATIFGLPAQAGAASPVHIKPSPYVFLSLRYVVPLSLVLVVLVGGGTASAAAGSALPGDVLYPIKINVNEAVKVALAKTPAAKAQAHAELADARVEEAQALAAKGRLDTAKTREIENNFDEHAKRAQELARHVADSDPAASVQITTELDSALAMNGSVLQALGRKSSDRETKSNSGHFASRVLGHVGAADRIARADTASMPTKAAEVRTMAVSLAGSEDSREGAGAAVVEAKAAEVLAGAREQFMYASSTLDATTTAQLGAQFSAVDTLMAQGSAALGAGDSAAALKNFTEALSKSAQLRAVLKAQVKYDGDILTPLLRFDDHDSSGD